METINVKIRIIDYPTQQSTAEAGGLHNAPGSYERNVKETGVINYLAGDYDSIRYKSHEYLIQYIGKQESTIKSLKSNLEKENACIKRLSERSTEIITNQKQRLDDLRDCNASLFEENEHLEEKIIKLQERNARLQKENEALDNLCKEKDTDAEHFIREMTFMDYCLDAKESKINALIEQLEKVEHNWKFRFDKKVAHALLPSQQKFERIRNRNKELQSLFEKSELSFKHASNHIKDLEKTIQNLRQDNKLLMLNATNQKVNACEDEISKLKDKNNRYLNVIKKVTEYLCNNKCADIPAYKLNEIFNYLLNTYDIKEIQFRL